jgi:hypothetical protein
MQDSLLQYPLPVLSPATIQADTLRFPYPHAGMHSTEQPLYLGNFKALISEEHIGDTSISGKGYVDLFSSHELMPVHPGPVQKANQYHDWFFPVIMLVLVLYTWLRIFYNKFFSQLIQAFLNTNLTNQIVRDENIMVQSASIILAFTFHIIAALFLYLLSLQTGWSLGGMGIGFNRFLFFFLLVSAAYSLKFLILKITGWLFDLDREMATYIFNIFLINNVLGLVLAPITALMAFNPFLDAVFLARLCLWLIVFAFLYRLFRGLLSGLSVPGTSPLYIFLYLCTLEIAPLLVLIRIINP